MAHPLRVQRSRQRKDACPPGTVYVGRPGRWGNPFVGSGAVAAFRAWITGYETAARLALAYGCTLKFMPGINAAEWVKMHLSTLQGKHLACWCPLDKPCHADILCELANK